MTTSRAEIQNNTTEQRGREAAPCPVRHSFLLVNFNMPGLILRLIDNISDNVDAGAAYEVIIADNSTDATARLSAQHVSNATHVRIVTLTENRGFVNALNEIVPLATGEDVVIMHPDVELQPGCIHALSEFLKAHPQAAVVSPDLYYPNGAPCRIRLRFPSPATEGRRIINKISQILVRRKVVLDEVLWHRSGDIQSETLMSVCKMLRVEVLRN
jgi:GT2 family glycosyltransferase